MYEDVLDPYTLYSLDQIFFDSLTRSLGIPNSLAEHSSRTLQSMTTIEEEEEGNSPSKQPTEYSFLDVDVCLDDPTSE